MLATCVLATCLVYAAAQTQCTPERLSNLQFTATLLARALTANNKTSGSDVVPVVGIQDVHVVCLATLPKVGSYETISVIITYTCTGCLGKANSYYMLNARYNNYTQEFRISCCLRLNLDARMMTGQW